MRISFERVHTWTMALELLAIRNACREDMTHHTDYITSEQQFLFWEHELKSGRKYEAYLLRDHYQAIGFGMLKRNGDKVWMTIGLAQAQRGKRLSYLLTNLITAMGHRDGSDVWLDVKRGAFVEKVYEACGYVFEYATDGLIVMRHRTPNPIRRMSRLLEMEVKI